MLQCSCRGGAHAEQHVVQVRMVKELPISTQDKLNLIHEFRMAETMDDIIR